jgi:hypothetical protein
VDAPVDLSDLQNAAIRREVTRIADRENAGVLQRVEYAVLSLVF